MLTLKNIQRKLPRTLFYILLLITVAIVFFPIYYMIICSIRPATSLLSNPAVLFPTEFSLNSYYELLTKTDFLIFMKNSLIVTSGAVILTICCAVPAGYTLAKRPIIGKKLLARSVLFTYMLPSILIGIPLYLMFNYLQLTNTYLGLMLALTSSTLPFSLWLMWQFFQVIPSSIEEAAWVCGAGRARAIFDVMIPMAKPAIVTIAIFSYALSWNDFTLSFIIMRKYDMYTLPVGMLLTLFEAYYVHWDYLFAGAVLCSIPSILIVYFLQHYLLRGYSIAKLE